METKNNRRTYIPFTVMTAAIILIASLLVAAGFCAAEAYGADHTAAMSGAAEGTQLQTSGQPSASPIIKKGRYYYYRNPETGKIRKKAGFVKYNGKRYYVRRGGRIITNKTFRVLLKQYRAGKNGAIKTGVYKWSGKYWYSKPSTGQWIKKEKLVSWKGDRYYIQKGGQVLMDNVFTLDNTPYVSDESGHVSAVAIPESEGNPVAEVAKSQVGIMTGITYWVWYFKTKFIDTDRTPWCGTFVAWCYNAAGQYDKITDVKKYGNLGYVPSYSWFADRKGKWVSRKTARPGDIIIFGRNAHVGLVEGMSDGYIITIEGNAGPTAAFGCGKAGAVVRKIYEADSGNIKGVIRVM